MKTESNETKAKLYRYPLFKVLYNAFIFLSKNVKQDQNKLNTNTERILALYTLN